MPAPSPCVWEKLEAALLRYVVSRWWWDFSRHAKKRIRWMMLGNATLSAFVVLGAFVNLAQVQATFLAVALLAVGCSFVTVLILLTWLVLAWTIDEGTIGMTNPMHTWLRELGTSAYTDEDLVLLEELSEAIKGGDHARLSNLINRAPPDLRETALFRELRNDVEAIERALQRSRRRS